MNNYVFREIKALATKTQQVLEDADLNLFILECGVLYHAVFDDKLTLSKGTSLRMSKITYIIKS